ncbi:CVNH domain-containing protein [Exilibacterium tricleocarpae]
MPSLVFAGGFDRSCWNIRLKNSCTYQHYCNLGATCKRKNGTANAEAWINLTNHIGNSDGYLARNSSGFSSTCQEVQLSGTRLDAICIRRSGQLAEQYSAAGLADCIANRDGNLVWSC